MGNRQIISFDVHCQETEAVVMAVSGRVSKRARLATTVPDLSRFIESVAGSRDLVIEEGPLADWLYRNLSFQVEQMVVCDPRRNHLIAKDGDKDDPIDAEKLGHLYRGGYVKAVHHPSSLDRSAFKEQVGLYHDRVRNRVRQANRIMGQLRRHGVFVRESAFADGGHRKSLLERLPKHAVVRANLQMLLRGYDAAAWQVQDTRRRLLQLARKEPQIRRFTALPGVGWIRAATFFAYLDTPWRFRSKSALWKYLGIGLDRRQSGCGPTQLGLSRQVNRCLKSVILGAVKSAIASRRNPFAEQYERWQDAGLTSRIARRNVARSQAAVMWGMWKNSSVYRPECVGVSAVASGAVVVQ